MIAKDDYLDELLSLFRLEAQEHVDAMSQGLIDLEKATAAAVRSELIEIVYRESHSLKGAARAVDMVDIEGLCQKLETVFASIKRGHLDLRPELFDSIHRCINALSQLLEGGGGNKLVPWRDLGAELENLAQKIQQGTPPVNSQNSRTELSAPEPAPSLRPALSYNGGSYSDTTNSSNNVGATNGVNYPTPTAPAQPLQTEQATIQQSAQQAITPAPAANGNQQAAQPPATQPPARPGNGTHYEAPQPTANGQTAAASAAMFESGAIAPKALSQSPTPAAAATLPATPQHAASTGAAETIRVSTAKLDSLLLQAEELLSAKLMISHRGQEITALSNRLSLLSKEWAKIQSDVRALQQEVERDEQQNGLAERRRHTPLRRVLEFIEWNRQFNGTLATDMSAVSRAADSDQSTLATLTDTLLDDMKKVLTLPFASFTGVLPKMVRDVSRDCGKQVDLKIGGGEVEIDRRILEALKDPLIHILRNAVDHGIETPAERRAAGKSDNGTLLLQIVQKDANKIEIVIADDGAGIDARQVSAAAVRSGLVQGREAEAMDAATAMSFIFNSGLSTSPMITELSGRGLGLAIVREKVEKLGGTVTVESQPGAGTTFRLLLPLTLATVRGVLVRLGDRMFVLPTTHVERVVSVYKPDIRTVGGRDTITFNGRVLPLLRLSDALTLPEDDERTNRLMVPAVVLGAGDRQIAFLVSEVLGEQEVLVKSLGPQLRRVRNVSGATVLGSGRVVPILSAPDLLKWAPLNRTVRVERQAIRPAARQKSVLVAEDSITSRTLLKNILETAGYRVRTAIDGVDALTNLRTEQFDVLLSDVEMPRMNGFQLTAQVRADTQLKDLPVVLVTSLESREDRERGVEAGANAYMVKRGLDQSNLLDVIARLT